MAGLGLERHLANLKPLVWARAQKGAVIMLVG